MEVQHSYYSDQAPHVRRGRRRYFYLTALFLFASLQPVAAQDQCFCLQDTYDNWLRDCREVKVGPAPQPKTLCYDPAVEHRVEISLSDDWQRIDAGQAGCTPCGYQAVRGPDPPRGDEQAEQDTPGQEEPDAAE